MRSDLFALQRGLAASGVNLSAGFSKWQIVLGNDPHRVCSRPLISRRNSDFLSAAVLSPPVPHCLALFQTIQRGDQVDLQRHSDRRTAEQEAALPYQVRSPVYPDPVEMSF
jgi:hypothetical protein